MYKTPNVSRRLVLILGGTLLFMAALGAFLFWYLGGQEKAATKQAKEFIAALEKNDPSAAPKNGGDYVRGVWKAYRRVDSAKLIDTHQRSSRRSGSSNSGTSWWVADMLLHTGRGLAVLELKFEPNHLDPDDQVIDLLYELTPDRIPSGTLDTATLARVKSDQRERGPKPEDGITLDVNARSPSPSAPPVARGRAPKHRQPPIIKCIRRAHGDVAKIQKCSRLAGN